MIKSFPFIACIMFLFFVPRTSCASIDGQFEANNDINDDLGLFSHDELDLDDWKQTYVAASKDGSKGFSDDDGLTESPHEFTYLPYSSPGQSMEGLEHLNDGNESASLDLSDDEIIQSFFDDKDNIAADGISRDISDFMDSVFDKNDPTEGLEHLYDNEVTYSEESEGTLPIEDPELVDHKVKSMVKNGSYNDPHYRYMIKEIQSHLLQKLNKGLMRKSYYKRIPWKQLKRTDLINWPDDVRFSRIIRQGRPSLEKLHSNLQSMDFTRDFLDRYSRTLQNEVDQRRQSLVEKINTHLLDSLNASTLGQYKRIPWVKLEKGDIVNWPSSIPMLWPTRFRLSRLEQIDQVLDTIYFKPAALERLGLKNVGDGIR